MTAKRLLTIAMLMVGLVLSGSGCLQFGEPYRQWPIIGDYTGRVTDPQGTGIKGAQVILTTYPLDLSTRADQQLLTTSGTTTDGQGVFSVKVHRNLERIRAHSPGGNALSEETLFVYVAARGTWSEHRYVWRTIVQTLADGQYHVPDIVMQLNPAVTMPARRLSFADRIPADSLPPQLRGRIGLVVPGPAYASALARAEATTRDCDAVVALYEFVIPGDVSPKDEVSLREDPAVRGRIEPISTALVVLYANSAKLGYISTAEYHMLHMAELPLAASRSVYTGEVWRQASADPVDIQVKARQSLYRCALAGTTVSSPQAPDGASFGGLFLYVPYARSGTTEHWAVAMNPNVESRHPSDFARSIRQMAAAWRDIDGATLPKPVVPGQPAVVAQ